jgi:RimJ/RimL family protein N-acetyltransferase
MLYGKRMRLRAIERGDIPILVGWFNDPEVRQHLILYEPLSREKEEHWFDALLDMKDRYFFIIEIQKGEQWASIGTVDLFRVDWKNRVVNFGITIGEKIYWGKGYGSDATCTALLFAFHELNLYRVEWEVFEENLRAIRCYEKIGFQHEGTRRKAFFRDGSNHDVYFMGILQDEFREEQEVYLQNEKGAEEG